MEQTRNPFLPPALPTGAAMRVLVAEDDVTSRSLLCAILRKWGYEVLAVVDGSQAWEVLQKPTAPKLVILDWLMPGLDGLEVCRRVRALAAPEPPYVIMLTSMEQKADVVRGLDTGANDYITKPYHAEELQARVAVGRRVVELQEALLRRVAALQDAVNHIKTLQGILPICMHCHKIRDDQASWERIEFYFSKRSEAILSRSICPDCARKHQNDPNSPTPTSSPRGQPSRVGCWRDSAGQGTLVPPCE